MLCWALRKTDVPIVLIEGSSTGPLMPTLPLNQRAKLTIIDHIPQHLLASAYAAAAVHTSQLDGNMWPGEPGSRIKRYTIGWKHVRA